MTPQATKPIEEIFFSRTRIRIIKLLTISQMRGRLRLNYAIVASNLAVLEENSIVRQLRSGRRRYYRLNEGCQKVPALKQVISEWQRALHTFQMTTSIKGKLERRHKTLICASCSLLIEPNQVTNRTMKGKYYHLGC